MLKKKDKSGFMVISDNVQKLTEREKNNRIKNSVVDIIEGEKPFNMCELITTHFLTVSSHKNKPGFTQLKISVGEGVNSCPVCFIMVKDPDKYFKAMEFWKRPLNISSIGTAGNLKTTIVYKKEDLCQ